MISENIVLVAWLSFILGGGFMGLIVHWYYRAKYADFIAAQDRFENGLRRDL